MSLIINNIMIDAGFLGRMISMLFRLMVRVFDRLISGFNKLKLFKKKLDKLILGVILITSYNFREFRKQKKGLWRKRNSLMSHGTFSISFGCTFDFPSFS